MKRIYLDWSLLAVLAMATPALARDDAVSTAGWPGIGLVAWLVIGLIAGYFASLVVKGRGEGVALDIVLGIVGAYIGGIIFHALGESGVTGFNAWSILVAFLGAVILLTLFHALSGSRKV